MKVEVVAKGEFESNADDALTAARRASQAFADQLVSVKVNGVEMSRCRRCDEFLDPSNAKPPGHYEDDPDLGPVVVVGRLYCSLGCASDEEGWA